MTFRYESDGISIRDGGRTFRKHERGWVNKLKPWALAVESPLAPDQDIGGKCAVHEQRVHSSKSSRSDSRTL